MIKDPQNLARPQPVAPPDTAQPMRSPRNACASPYMGSLQNLTHFLRFAPVRPLLYPEKTAHVGDAGATAGGNR